MTSLKPRIAIPEPNSLDNAYSERTWPEYAAAVEREGAVPVRIPLAATPETTAGIVATCDGILLPGSSADIDPQKYGEQPDRNTALPDPAREAVDELLLQDAFNLGKPLFGICYGHQSLNVWRGGTLTQHLFTSVDHRPGRDVARAHLIGVTAGNSRLSTAFLKGGEVNSSHHQAVNKPGDGLIVTGISPEDEVIEAVEGTGPHFVLGVQWHPERTPADSASRQLFHLFIDAARKWHPRINGV